MPRYTSNRLPRVGLSVKTYLLAPLLLCSSACNQLCGLDSSGNGTYNSEGITKLCEAVQESAVTSLKCATTPLLFCVGAR